MTSSHADHALATAAAPGTQAEQARDKGQPRRPPPPLLTQSLPSLRSQLPVRGSGDMARASTGLPLR